MMNPQEKKVATTGLVMSGMTDKLKLIHKVISTLPWMVHKKDFLKKGNIKV